MLIRYRSDIFTSDLYLIDIVPGVFAIWGCWLGAEQPIELTITWTNDGPGHGHTHFYIYTYQKASMC